MKTSFAALALVAAAASVQAADLPTCAPATNLLWVNRPDSKACATASGYVPSTYATPTQEIFDKFCPVESCRNMIAAILAVRPAAGDCVYKPSSLGVNIKFYEAYVDVFAKACNVAPGTTAPPATTTPAPVPTTTAPVPTTTAPVPTTTAPVPTTTAPVPTTTSPTPTVTTKTPCPLPQPTTARPQC